MSINKATLMGDVCTEPRITTFDNGDKIANFSISTREPAYKTLDGKDIPESIQYHRIVVRLRRLVEKIECKNFTKGDIIYVEGKILTRYYNNETTGKHPITEIHATVISNPSDLREYPSLMNM